MSGFVKLEVDCWYCYGCATLVYELIAVITMYEYELYCERTARSARYAAISVEWIAATTLCVLFCEWTADTATYVLH